MQILAQLPSFWGVVVTMVAIAFGVALLSFADANAKGGWSSFAKRYRVQSRPDGKPWRVPGWTYCDVHWNERNLRVIFTDDGIYFYMTFPRRLAHPPFLVPWQSVKDIKKVRGFLGEYSVLEIEDAAGRLQLDLSKKLERALARYKKWPDQGEAA